MGPSIERHMENQSSSVRASGLMGVSSFVAAVVFTSLAIWLCILGDFPSIKIGDRGYMIMFSRMVINGVELPGWAFYFIPGGLFVIAIGLLFLGWHRCVSRQHEGT
jgi:hypothetical protein